MPDLRKGIVLPSLGTWRVRRALSQDELAARAHVARWTVQRAEHGLPVRTTTLGKLARALGVKRDELLRPSSPQQADSAT